MIPQFLWGKTVGSSILAGATAHGRDSFALINEGFDPARAITKRAISHPNDGQQGLLP
jgi:predicted aconitase with swiveling domain